MTKVQDKNLIRKYLIKILKERKRLTLGRHFMSKQRMELYPLTGVPFRRPASTGADKITKLCVYIQY